MGLVERVIQETAEALGIDPSEVDWITEESLESALFGAQEDDGQFDDRVTEAPLATCTPLSVSGPRYPVRFAGVYCYGRRVSIWSPPNAVRKGYNLVFFGSRMSWKQVLG